jgi:hypothetical protein
MERGDILQYLRGEKSQGRKWSFRPGDANNKGGQGRNQISVLVSFVNYELLPSDS